MFSCAADVMPAIQQMNETANEKCYGLESCRLEGCYEFFFENGYTNEDIQESLKCERPALWLTIR